MLQTYFLFTWWQALATRTSRLPQSTQWLFLGASGFVGLVVRLLASQAPANFDFDSYVLVAETVINGSSPYSTGRYNYGAPWAFVVAGVYALTQDTSQFRLALSILLWGADFSIAYLLMRMGYLVPGLLFMLVPTTVAISGQHQQFDALAIAIGLLAVVIAQRSSSAKLTSRDVVAILLLGLSITTKHLLILLPLWLAMGQPGARKKLAYALGPLLVFLFSLAPYLVIDAENVVRYVLEYRSTNNAPIYYALLPDEFVWGAVNRGWITGLFLLLVLATGYLFRRLPPFEMTLVYLVTFVLLSSAVADQYLSVPTAGVLVYLNLGFLAWLSLTSIYLLGEPTDLNLPVASLLKEHLAPRPEQFFLDMTIPLAVGWLLMVIQLQKKRLCSEER